MKRYDILLKQLITAEQITEVQASQHAIRKHAYEINRPYSVLFSLALFPPLMTLLLLNEYSPFHGIYTSYYLRLLKVIKERSILNNVMGSNFKADVEMLKDVLSSAQEVIQAGRKSLNGGASSLLRGSQMTEAEILGYVAAHPDTVPGFSIVHLRQSMINATLTIIRRYSTTVPLNYSELSLGALYSSALELSQGVDKAIEKVVSGELGLSIFNKLTFIPRILFAILGQKFIVDKLLAWYFPIGVFQSSVSNSELPDNIELLNSVAADDLIKRLRKTEAQLEKTAQRNVLISRALIPILFGISYAYPGEEVSLYTGFMLLCALSCSVKGLWHEGVEYFRSYVYESRLLKRKAQYETLFRDLFESVDVVDYGDIESSQVSVEFKRVEGLSSKAIREIINNVFLSHGLKHTVVTNNGLILPVSLDLSENKIRQIRVDIDRAIAREKQVGQLKKQLIRLDSSPFIYVQSFPNLERHFLKTLDVEFRVHQELSQHFLDAFSHDQPEVIPHEGYVLLKLRIDDPIDGDVLGSLLEKPGSLFKRQLDLSTDYSGASASQNASSAKGSKRRSKSRESEREFKRVVAESDEVASDIQWKSATYQPDSSTNSVVPIRNARNQFTLFAMKKDDFPDDASYRAFSAIISEQPRSVGPEASQGLVYAAEMHQDRKGPPFKASLKAKALGGLFGDMRVYAEEEKAKTGETLHVFKYLAADAH